MYEIIYFIIQNIFLFSYIYITNIFSYTFYFLNNVTSNYSNDLY